MQKKEKSERLDTEMTQLNKHGSQAMKLNMQK